MAEQATIPPAAPLLGYQSYREEIDAAIRSVMSGGRYILGDQVSAFEAEFASYVGVRWGVGVGSGTDALYLALGACEIGPGDEVITVSHTAVATVAAICMRGATPVLVDIDSSTMAMDPAQIERAVTAHTRAIIPVHLYGHPVDLEPILALARQYSLRVIEDCAQSHGARYRGRLTGAWGDMGCFSFYPTKNLGAIGDAGLVVTDDAALAERLRLLRQYGWQRRYVSVIEGTNSRLDEVQAAILRVKLRHLDEDNARRREHAAAYDLALDGCGLELPQTARWAEHCFHQYVVRSPQRDQLADFLHRQGIGTLIHYPVPVHLQPAYSRLNIPLGSLPQTELAAARVLSLPVYPELTARQTRTVADAVLCWARRDI